MKTKQVKTVTINGWMFQIYKIPMLQRIVADRKVARLTAPVMGMMQGLDISALAKIVQAEHAGPEARKALDSEFGDKLNLNTMIEAVKEALATLSDKDLMSLATELLSVVNCRHPTQGAVLLDSEEAINTCFEDWAPIDLYRLLIEVMRENKLTPFELRGAGRQTPATDTSEEPEQEIPESGNRSGISGRSMQGLPLSGRTGEP